MPQGAQDGRGSGGDAGRAIDVWARTGNWGAVRRALAQLGYQMKDIKYGQKGYNVKGNRLDSALRFYKSGGTPMDWNQAMGMPDEDARTAPGHAAAPNGPVARASGGNPSGGTAGLDITGDSLAIPPINYQDVGALLGQAPSMVSVGTLMGRNPFGPGFGFNPTDYANAVTNAKYKPLLQSLTNQITSEKELQDASVGRLNKVYDPLIEQTKQGAERSQQFNQNLAQVYGNLANQVGGGSPLAGDIAGGVGYLGDMAKIGFNDDMGRVETAARTKADVEAEFLANSNQNIRDTRDQRSEVLAGRGDDYRASLIEGMNQRSNLQTQAIANRGALYNQSLTAAMAPSTIAQSGLQAQGMLDDLIRARQSGEIDQKSFNLQLEQARRAGMIDDLTIEGMRRDLIGANTNGNITQMKPDELTQAWSYLVNNYAGLNGQVDENGANIPPDFHDPAALQAMIQMARGMGITGNDKDIENWVRRNLGDPTAPLIGGASDSPPPRANNGRGNPKPAAKPARPKTPPKNGTRKAGYHWEGGIHGGWVKNK